MRRSWIPICLARLRHVLAASRAVPCLGNANFGGIAVQAADGTNLIDSRSITPWNIRKTQILQSFTTTGTIQMPSFISAEVAKAARGGIVPTRLLYTPFSVPGTDMHAHLREACSCEFCADTGCGCFAFASVLTSMVLHQETH